MNNLLLPYLLGSATTVVILLLSSLNYIRGKRERMTYEQERARLPDAVRLVELDELRQRSEQEYDAIQDRLSNARLLVAERDNAEKWLNSSKVELLRLKGEREEQEALRRNLEMLRDELGQINEQINRSQASLSSINAELAYFEKIKSQKDNELKQLEDQRDRLLDEKTKIATELHPLQIKLAGIQATIDSKNDELELVSGNMEKRIHHYEQRLVQTKQFIEEDENKLKQVREHIETSTKTLNECRTALNMVQKELDFLESNRNQKQTEVQTLATQLQSLVEEKHRVESDLQPLRNTLAGIQANIDSKVNELNSLSSSMEKRLQQYQDQLSQNEQLVKRSEEKLENTKNSVESATRELHSVRDERSRLSADIQALQREKVALEDLIKNLRADWNTVLRLSGQDEGADERRTQELWVPYIEKRASDFKVMGSRSELDLLARTESYLKSMRLYFPRRVLWAFHTSLKVTDISPLVVLAGISGTGKSELPRRYAESMGLHFLNVAVQPRWDSPQDMFGFFNYLENRYRATELGRALVQMDPFHAEKGRGWSTPKNWEYSLSSQILLVLLDEMNLARVEYYFSEFLSRLETRRGIKRNDPQSRRKAEIGLEVGSGKTSSPIMQLFVDQNVLFVGTMNEDETTQALSDKVIDRANVLRFGRPGKIEQALANSATIETDAKLRYTEWISWCKRTDDLPAETTEIVQSCIGRLDEAMNLIKRPFGFRTRNGILSYVANYPSTDSDAVGDALADQIEQKIIPKFRGLDPRDHEVKSAIGKVRTVLSDLGDDLLCDAIDRLSRESQFVWLGVNRFDEELRDDLKSIGR